MSCKAILSSEREADILVAALFFLMTRYAHHQDQLLVQPILDHFDWLTKHPDLVDSQLQKTCMRLQKSWLLMPEVPKSKEQDLSHFH